MTDTTFALAGMAKLADKGPDVDMLRQMVQFMARRLMDMDVESLCGAGYDEKSAERCRRRSKSEAQFSVGANTAGELVLLPVARGGLVRRVVVAMSPVEPQLTATGLVFDALVALARQQAGQGLWRGCRPLAH